MNAEDQPSVLLPQEAELELRGRLVALERHAALISLAVIAVAGAVLYLLAGAR